MLPTEKKGERGHHGVLGTRGGVTWGAGVKTGRLSALLSWS
jgi:hypothetical protein